MNLDDPTELRDFAEDNAEAGYLWDKVVTARFFAWRILSLAPAKAKVILSGDDTCMQAAF